MRHVTSSPSLTTAAPGVPVEITSPGIRVITREWKDISSSRENIIRETTFSAFTLPFTTVATLSLSGAVSSSRVIRQGPKEKNESNDLERVRYRGFICKISSAVTSIMQVNPATASIARPGFRFRTFSPMMIPSSASAVVRFERRGIFIKSPEPITAVDGFIKLAGKRPGIGADRSRACSR